MRNFLIQIGFGPRFSLIFTLFFGLCTSVLGQSVGISTNSLYTSSGNAILDLDAASGAKGLLIPRMTTAERGDITPSPSGFTASLTASDEGMTIFNIDTDRFEYWDGVRWQTLLPASATGNTLDEAYDEGGTGSGRVITADAGAIEIQGSDGLLVIGDAGFGVGSTSYQLDAQNTANRDAFYFRSADVTTGERDVFTIVDEDTGGGSQDGSSSLKVLRTGAFSASDDGSSLLELTYTGGVADPDEQFYVLGRTVDEGLVSWGVSANDADVWTSGSLRAGATGTSPSGTNAPAFNAPSIAFEVTGDSYLNTGGNLGIGTSLPSEQLDVDGNIRMRSGATNGYIPVGDANGVMTWTDPSLLVTSNDNDWLENGNHLYNGNTGNVGIGLTAPTEKLDVAGNIIAQRLFVKSNTVTTTSDLSFTANAHIETDNAMTFSMDSDDNETNNYIAFGTNSAARDGNFLELMTIEEGGDVGIGVTNPGDLLHLGTGGMRFTNSEYTNTSDVSGALFFDENYSASGEPGYPHLNGDGGGLAVKNQDGWGVLVSTANMQWLDMHLNTLHIGDPTNDPTEQLQVTGSAYVTDRIRAATTTTTGRINAAGDNDLPGLWLTGEDNIWFDDGQVRITTHDGYGNWQIKSGADNDDVKIGSSDGAVKIRVDESGRFYVYTQDGLTNGDNISWNLGLYQQEDGNVGIGNTPTQKLDVDGSVRIRGGSPSAGKVLTATDANGNSSWQVISGLPQRVVFSEASDYVFYSDSYIQFRWQASGNDIQVAAMSGHTGWWDIAYWGESHDYGPGNNGDHGAGDYNLGTGWTDVDYIDVFPDDADSQYGGALNIYVSKEDSNTYPTYKMELMRHGIYVTAIVTVYQ